MRPGTLLLVGGFIAAVTLLTLYAYARLVAAQDAHEQPRAAVEARYAAQLVNAGLLVTLNQKFVNGPTVCGLPPRMNWELSG